MRLLVHFSHFIILFSIFSLKSYHIFCFSCLFFLLKYAISKYLGYFMTFSLGYANIFDIFISDCLSF